MNSFFIGVSVTVFTYLIIGLYAGKAVKNVNDYYVSGRNATTLLITGTLFASAISASSYTGDQGAIYSGAWAPYTMIYCICSAGMALGPVMFGRYLRRSECLTLPEYFGKRFNDRGIRRIAGIVVTISVTAYLVSCLSSVGLLLSELTGLPRITSLFIGWMCFTLFTFYSGSRGVVITDTCMFLVFVLGTFLAGHYIFARQGGVQSLVVNLMNNPSVSEGALSYHGNFSSIGTSDIFNSIMFTATLGFAWFVTLSVAPWQAGRFLMAKNEHVAIRAGIIGCIFQIFFQIDLDSVSMAVLNINDHVGNLDSILIWAAMNVLPKIVGIIFMAGIMSAGLSSASTFLSVISFSITSDIVDIPFRSDTHKLWITRFVTLAVGIAAFLLSAIGVGSIRIVAIFASTVLAAGWAVPCFGGILSRKLSAYGARLSMLGGLLGFLIPKICVSFVPGIFQPIFRNFLDPFLTGIYVSILCAILGSIKYPASAEAITYHSNLMTIPEKERSSADYRRDKMYARALIVSGVVITVMLLYFWALPYNGII